MTDILVLGENTITLENIKESLDGKVRNMSDFALQQISEESVDFIKSQTDITLYNEKLVIAAVYKFIRWQIYMLYIESISEYVVDQGIRIEDDRIRRFRETAELFLSRIDVSIRPTTILNSRIVLGSLTDGAKV